MRRSAWLLLLLSGCGGGLERAALATDLLSYAPGDRVELSLSNGSATALGINLCLSQLVSLDGKTRGPSNLEPCDFDLQVLEVGDRATSRKTLPPTTGAGSWRYETTIRLPSGQGEKVLSAPFTVTGS